MHITSTINHLSRSNGDVPVGVFQYNDQRKFLRVSEDYHEMLITLKRTFNIPATHALSLSTSSLDACRRQAVEIEESAYGLMVNLLDEVEVHAEEQKATQRQQGTQDWASDSELTSVSTPTPLSTAASDDKEQYTRTTAPRTDSRAQQSSSFPPPPTKADVKPQRTPHRYPQQITPTTTALTPTPTTSSSAAASLSSQHQEQEETEEEEVNQTITAYERDREIYEARIGEEDEEEYWLAVESSSRVQQKGKARSMGNDGKASSSEEGERSQAFKPVMKAFSDAKFTPKIKTESIKTESPAVATNTARKLTSQGTRSSVKSETQTPIDPDSRFEITITGPNGQVAQFKTRGKHSVGKVLMAACKSFGIDYDRSQLYYMLTVEEDDGRRRECEFQCDVADTMSCAGINGNSVLFIKSDDQQGNVGEDDDLMNFE